MFKLVKILGGRINHGEPRMLEVPGVEKTIAAETPVAIVGGYVLPADGELEEPITHILDADAKAGASSIRVVDLLPGMVFMTTLTDNIDEYNIGTEYIINNGGISAIPVATRGCGAVLYDWLRGEEENKVLVTFRAI